MQLKPSCKDYFFVFLVAFSFCHIIVFSLSKVGFASTMLQLVHVISWLHSLLDEDTLVFSM
jgi:hypothetical protein